MLHAIQSQKQQAKILPHQIQMLNFFQLTKQEIEQKLSEEMIVNPFLEVLESNEEELATTADKAKDDFRDWEECGYDDIPDYKTEVQNYLPETEVPDRPFKSYISWRETLKEQLRYTKLNEQQIIIGNYIIDQLGENGLLQKDMEELADDFSFSHFMINSQTAQQVLKTIQQAEPAGIAAASIRECLLLQLQRMDKRRPDVTKALLLLQTFYKDLQGRQFDRIMHRLGIDEEELSIVLKLIGSLNMYPVHESENYQYQAIQSIPEIRLALEGDQITVTLLHKRGEYCSINESAWKDYTNNAPSEAVSFYKGQMQNAKWLVDAIRQRESNMLKVGRAIAAYQYDFLMTGDVNMMRPMVLRNIAAETNLDVSTISRIASNKYADTPYGIILLKQLFSEGVSNDDGDVISNKVIRQAIADLVEREDKTMPYSDFQIVEKLQEKGLKIARRTVAKYRDILKIPVASMRTLMMRELA